MTRFFFFTKTDWPEPPRLRHQLAALLVRRGHDVVFFEKPSHVFRPRRSSGENVPGMRFLRTRELVNHKLRMNAPIRIANAAFEIREITNALNSVEINHGDIVVNFCYDYWFLRRIFPNNVIMTVINDDFWCRAIFGYERPLFDVVSMTCRSSDKVLVVSKPLKTQLASYCDPEIFYPWSDIPYAPPKTEAKRTRLLFWGYINNRLNFPLLEMLANGIMQSRMDVTIDFVGPVQDNIDRRFCDLVKLPCVSLRGPSGPAEIDFDSVLAAIIPYVEGNRADDVTDIPNKAFPMLSRGLPLLISGMPNFIEKPFVYRIGAAWPEGRGAIEKLKAEFWEQQPNIESFVNMNLEEHRYRQLLACIRADECSA